MSFLSVKLVHHVPIVLCSCLLCCSCLLYCSWQHVFSVSLQLALSYVARLIATSAVRTFVLIHSTMSAANLPPLAVSDDADNYAVNRYSFCDRIKHYCKGGVDDAFIVPLQHAIVFEAGIKNMSTDQKVVAQQQADIQRKFLLITKQLLDETAAP